MILVTKAWIRTISFGSNGVVSMEEVTIYTKPGCMQCKLSKRRMDAKGVKYNAIDVSEHPEFIEQLKTFGYQSLPVTKVGESLMWQGFRPNMIDKIEKV